MIEALSSLELNIVVSLPNKPSKEYQDIILKYAIKIYIFRISGGDHWSKPEGLNRKSSMISASLMRLILFTLTLSCPIHTN